MDRKDLAILEALEADARLSFATLAERVGLSKTPCWSRVQSFERQGTIKGYRAVLDASALGLGLNAFIEVAIDLDAHSTFETAVLAHPSILACYTTAGDADYLLHVVTRDVGSLDDLLRHEISRLPGVQRSSTTVCLKTIKEGALLTKAASEHASPRLRATGSKKR